LRYIKRAKTHAKISMRHTLQLILCGLLAIIGINFLLQVNALADYVLPGFGLLLLVYLTILTMQQDAKFRKKMALLNILIVSSIVFWMLYLQLFFSANLFIDRLVSKEFLGLHLTTTLFYASESVFIILLGPLFAISWSFLGRKNKNPSPVSKFIFGIFFAGLGFLLLSLSTHFPNEMGLVQPGWVFASYFLITIGELMLSPIGLSAVTMLAPSHLVGFMMGVWFVATGFGGVFAGTIAKLSSVPVTAITTTQKLVIYQDAFMSYAEIAFFVAIALFFSQFIVKKFILR
jgi:POT family proton-dependent oligopeptide transporter